MRRFQVTWPKSPYQLNSTLHVHSGVQKSKTNGKVASDFGPHQTEVQLLFGDVLTDPKPCLFQLETQLDQVSLALVAGL